jgi:hypothetical protein
LPLAFIKDEADSLEKQPPDEAAVPELQPALVVNETPSNNDQQQHFSMKTVEIMKSWSLGDEYVGRVNHCQFHPTKLKFCCALDAGVICVVTPSHQTEWQKNYFGYEKNSAFYRIGWNVSKNILNRKLNSF